MRNVKIYKGEEDALYFILSQFVTTHGIDQSKNIYAKELKLAQRLVDESKKVFANCTLDENNEPINGHAGNMVISRNKQNNAECVEDVA